MRRTLTIGSKKLEIMPTSEVRSSDQVKTFRDANDALTLLRQAANNQSNMAVLRDAASDAGIKMAGRLNDQMLLTELANKLFLGALKVAEPSMTAPVIIAKRRKPPPPPVPPRPPKPPPPPPPPQPKPKIKLVDFIEVVDKGSGPVKVSRSKTKGVYRQYINLGKDIEGGGNKRRPDYDRYLEVRAKVAWVDKKTKDSIAGRKVHFTCVVDKGEHRPDPLKPAEKEGFESSGGAAEVKVAVDAEGWTPATKFYLSQYGGDKFTVKAQADVEDLGTASGEVKELKSYQVWKKFWYQISFDKKMSICTPAKSVTAYEKTFTEFAAADEKKYQKKDLPHPDVTYYPEWMVSVGGGTDEVPIVGGHNRTDFYGLLKAEAAKPLKAHLILCCGQWDPMSGVKNIDTTVNSNPSPWLNINLGAWNGGLLKPALDGDLVKTGSWECLAPNGSNDYQRKGALTDDDIIINKSRAALNYLKVKLPDDLDDGETTTHGVRVKLELRWGKYYAGESNGYQILIVVCDSTDMFNDTITHETGHAFNQTPRPTKQPASLGNHPNQYTEADGHGGSGSHCSTDKVAEAVSAEYAGGRWLDGTCIMFHQQTKACKHEFCATCDPYVKLQDMTALLQPK
jgi:hypothetical protein